MVPEIWSAADIMFLSFWSMLSPNNLENQNFEKMKKMPGDIIILEMCTINETYMERDEFFLILDCFFFLFTPLTTHKIKILKK